jgi:hypothetical protein
MVGSVTNGEGSSGRFPAQFKAGLNFLPRAEAISSVTKSDSSTWICNFSLGKPVRHFVRSSSNRSRQAICSGVGVL